jgi:RNA polymerase sigma-70 factor (ECF subfamily)
MSVDQRDNACTNGAATDGELLALVALGDVPALGVLYARYAPDLMRYVARIDPRDMEDVVHTVFVRVVRRGGNVHVSKTTARAWLFGLTARVLQERAHSFTRARRALSRCWARNSARAAPCVGDRQGIVRGVAKLSRAHSTVLLLHEVEGFSCGEIADMLSLPIRNVWTRLHSARRQLRPYYQHDE